DLPTRARRAAAQDDLHVAEPEADVGPFQVHDAHVRSQVKGEMAWPGLRAPVLYFQLPRQHADLAPTRNFEAGVLADPQIRPSGNYSCGRRSTQAEETALALVPVILFQLRQDEGIVRRGRPEAIALVG